jgi:nucleoside-diphosphate-sugar epimerase
MRRVPSIKKIQEYFDFKPKYRLSEGLKETIMWQKNII